MSAVQVPQAVYDGLEAVRRSGLTNMLDRHAVAHLAELMGHEEAARWLRENRDLYAKGVFRGFEVHPSPTTGDGQQRQVKPDDEDDDEDP